MARRYEIHPTLLSKWRQQLRRDPERAFQRDREPHDEQVHVTELEQMVGRLTMENALLKRPWRGSRNNSFRAPRLQRQDDPLDLKQQRETGAGLSLAAICRVLEVSRAAYYRARQPPAGDNETDAFSRRVIGWSLGRTLETELALAALRMTLETREFGPGLVHHSDRGVQYASGDYTGLLQQHGVLISMSRKANPYDNALAESFMKTLKYEEVYLFEYEDFAEAQRRIGQFLDHVYNEKRLHSALGYLPPVEYEQALSASTAVSAAVVG